MTYRELFNLLPANFSGVRFPDGTFIEKSVWLSYSEALKVIDNKIGECELTLVFSQEV